MPDILHDFPIAAAPAVVFEGVTTPRGLDSWWTERSSGTPVVGLDYHLFFGPDYDWRARVTACEQDSLFVLEMTRADDDWMGTRVSFALEPKDGGTWLRFAHSGWPAANEHHRISSFCWAMYLRVLKRHIEHGESVPYDQRLSV
jgi:uncharacterized protein YndB with AHSA1/START domain